jgi:hypothetical protein
MVVFAGCHMRHSKDGAKRLREMGCHVLERLDVTDNDRLEAAREEVEAVLRDGIHKFM